MMIDTEMGIYPWAAFVRCINLCRSSLRGWAESGKDTFIWGWENDEWVVKTISSEDLEGRSCN